jgi:hypothetical protein
MAVRKRDNSAAQADQMRAEVPSTIARSADKAVRTWKKTHDSAVGTYGEGQRAHRAAFAALKHTHEKVGDHWEPKARPGPSDPQAARKPPDSLTGGKTAQGVDANASLAHLRAIARELGIPGRSRMSRSELVGAVQKANRRETARARGSGR